MAPMLSDGVAPDCQTESESVSGENVGEEEAALVDFQTPPPRLPT
jgi:hypothetical protein